MRKSFQDEILWNPYNLERDWFILICRKHIKYLSHADNDSLQKLYYKSRQRFYGPQQSLFDIGDHCNSIFIILSGVINIEICSDEFGQNRCVLDSLGRGSVIGINYVITGDQWTYKAVNQSNMSARVIQIDIRVLKRLRRKQKDINKAMIQQEQYLRLNGVTQIDYVIDTHKFHQTDLDKERLNFR